MIENTIDKPVLINSILEMNVRRQFKVIELLKIKNNLNRRRLASKVRRSGWIGICEYVFERELIVQFEELVVSENWSFICLSNRLLFWQ